MDKEIKGKFQTRNLTNEQIREYKRHLSEQIDGENFMYIHKGSIMNITTCCRVSTLEAIKFRSKLGFKHHDIILTREQSVISKLTKLFSNEKILL